MLRRRFRGAWTTAGKARFWLSKPPRTIPKLRGRFPSFARDSQTSADDSQASRAIPKPLRTIPKLRARFPNLRVVVPAAAVSSMARRARLGCFPPDSAAIPRPPRPWRACVRTARPLLRNPRRVPQNVLSGIVGYRVCCTEAEEAGAPKRRLRRDCRCGAWHERQQPPARVFVFVRRARARARARSSPALASQHGDDPDQQDLAAFCGRRLDSSGDRTHVDQCAALHGRAPRDGVESECARERMACALPRRY